MKLLNLFIIYNLVNLIKSNDSIKTFELSIGLIYCNDLDLTKSNEILSELNNEKTFNSKVKIDIKLKSLKLSNNDNPISATLSICDKLIANNQLYAVVISNMDCLIKNKKSNELMLTVSAVFFTPSYYQLPVFDLNNRYSLFSDKSIYSSFIRMLPAYFYQINIWIEILKLFEWKSVNLIYCSDDEGRNFASRFQYLADQNDIKVNLVKIEKFLYFY